MSKFKCLPILFVLLCVSLTACVPPGAETYYRSLYTGTSDSFEIELKTVESVKPAPEGSTLRILLNENTEAYAGSPARLHFADTEKVLEGKIGQEVKIDVEEIPANLLNGLDFEVTIMGGGKEETVTFKREREERKNFYP